MPDNKNNEYKEQDIALSLDDLSGVSGGNEPTLEEVDGVPKLLRPDGPGVSPNITPGTQPEVSPAFPPEMLDTKL